MGENLRKIGSFYEEKAAEYLQKKGYRILVRNFRCRYGEIDLIAEFDRAIVFCEVKYRSSKEAHVPFEAVTPRKQQRISKTAFYYLATKSCGERDCRFDVIGISGDQIHHIENAFEYKGF